MAVVFFHQNSVWDAQGGIERYLSTLLEEAGSSGLLVTATSQKTDVAHAAQQVAVPLPFRRLLPKWLSYALGVAITVRTVRTAIERFGPRTLEFSRPEYFLISWMFKGAKVFTLHGTGPARSETSKYWIHHLSCLMLPLVADVVQIIGRDSRGLPESAKARLSHRLRYIDAWHADAFCATPFPDPKGALRVFFAGRLAPMKNPKLLFRIIDASHKQLQPFEFRYFGADEDKIPNGPLRRQFPSAGLLNATQLAQAIANCHVGILCSGYGEGSPFIVVETLASGRAFVLPPLPGLVATYGHCAGVRFASDYTEEAFIEALTEILSAIRTNLSPHQIAADVAGRNTATAARKLIQRLEEDHQGHATKKVL